MSKSYLPGSLLDLKGVTGPSEECIKDLIFELSWECPFINLSLGDILITIPGVVTAPEIISGIGNISQFKSADQLVCYPGLIPTSYSSGTFTSTRNRMAKRGQTSLAHMFHQIALTS